MRAAPYPPIVAYDYRLYFIDVDGRTTHAVDIICKNDAEAIGEAKRRLKSVLDVWQRDRFVGRVDTRAKRDQTTLAASSQSRLSADRPPVPDHRL